MTIEFQILDTHSKVKASGQLANKMIDNIDKLYKVVKSGKQYFSVLGRVSNKSN